MIIEKKKLSEMKLAEYNPRIHSEEFLEKLNKSINTFGYVEPIIWNKKTGNIVGGHARFKVLLKNGVTDAEVVVVDLASQKEKALNLQLNKNVGEWDSFALSQLLKELETEDKGLLELTGFDDTELENLLLIQLSRDEIEDINQEWTDMPEFNQHDLSAKRRILICFKDEDDVEGFAKLLKQKITDKTRSLWYPKQAQDIVKDLRYTTKNG